MKVLITGGAGYIGSTVATACLEAGIETVLIDDLSTGLRAFGEGRGLYVGDIADAEVLDRVLADHPDIDAVVHCAARIVVPESVDDPLGYYDTNVGKTVLLLARLRAAGIDRIVFSSSAAVYAAETGGGVDESGALAPSSPYASTKAMVEQILRDAAVAGDFRAIALRYFNPIGADPACAPDCRTRVRPMRSARSCRRRPRACRSRSPAPTGPRATVPACATTSMCGTSPSPMSPPCSASTTS